MNAIRHPLALMLSTAAAALLLGVAQFAAIDRLAEPRLAQAAVVTLPQVVVVGNRAQPVAAAVRLPTVVVTGHAERRTASRGADAARI